MPFYCLRLLSHFRFSVIALIIIFGLTAAITKAQIWTPVSPAPTTNGLMGIVYAKGQFVIVGLNGTILNSTDGATWMSRASGVTNTLYAVGANDDVFVAVGEGGTILTSTDGTTWTTRTSNTTSNLHGVAWSGTTFVAAGYESAVVTSTDGTSWTSRTLGTPTSLYGVSWGDNKFVAAGFDDMNGTVNTSTDGTIWTSQTVNAPDGLLSIAWCGNAFIAGSSGLVVSYNGITWTTYSPGLENFIFSTSGHSNRMVAVGGMGTILSSSDDTLWTIENSGVTASLNCVTWGNNLFVAVGETGTILTSPTTSGISGRRNGKIDEGPGITIKDHSVQFFLSADAAVTIRLYSLHGRLIRSMSGMLCKGEHATPILSGLAQGGYLLSFQAGFHSIQRPVVLMR